jgi:hypothetical protein
MVAVELGMRYDSCLDNHDYCCNMDLEILCWKEAATAFYPSR